MSEQIKKTLGAVRIVALIAVSLAGIVTATFASLPRTTAASVKKPDPIPLVARNYLDVLGLSPDALAAAGLNAGQAAQINANLQEHFDGEGAGLQRVIDTWGAAHRDADMARRAVQSGKGTVDDLTAKNATLATTLSNKTSAINAAFAAALGQTDNAIIEKLARIKANRPMNVPVQYLLTDRTEEEWRQLRDALSHKKQRDADTPPRESDPDAVAIISNANAEPATVAAAAGVASNLAGILAAMTQ